MKPYRDGHGGLVVRESRARSTGTLIQVIDNRDGSFDAGDLPWFTLCTDHGSVCSHDTRRVATDWAAAPEEWCHPEDNDPPEEQL